MMLYKAQKQLKQARIRVMLMDEATLRQAGFNEAEIPLMLVFFDDYTFDEKTGHWIKKQQ